MSNRVAHTAGAALGWLVVLGVVVKLAPDAVKEARQLVSELAGSARHALRRSSAEPTR